MSASSAGSQDITARLRKWTHAIDAAPASDLMDEAAREIEMLRMALARLADQDATFSVIGGNMIVDVDAKLTGAEREAIEWSAAKSDAESHIAEAAAERGYIPESGGDPRQWAKNHAARSATLRALLARLV